MTLARIVHSITIALSVAIAIVALVGFMWPSGRNSTSESCWLLLAGLFGFGLCILRRKVTRVIIGIIYGLFALQVTLFTMIIVSASGSRSQVTWNLLLAATLALFSITYLFYEPLKQLFHKSQD